MGKDQFARNYINTFSYMGNRPIITRIKTGLFTSPHIDTFRERIQIDDRMITEEEYTPLLTELFEISERNKIEITYFEVNSK